VKVLFIRFSSIGDIVLTFPVVSAVKTQHPNAHISFLTKKAFTELLSAQPCIDESIPFENSILQTRKWIRSQEFDIIIDLHKNTRSLLISLGNAKKIYRFEKLNFRKKLLTSLKVDRLPNIHIIDRYFRALAPLGLNKDEIGTSFSIPKEFEVKISTVFNEIPDTFICIALGAQFNTKKIPLSLLEQLIEGINTPIALLGDKNDLATGNHLVDKFKQKNIVNCAGKYTILQSASILNQSQKLITGDTGLMHIASFLDIDIISIWGNTTPKFGMYPYRKEHHKNDVLFEKKDLDCRPCSKIGYEKCPKGHFKCMAHDSSEIIRAIE